MEDKFIEKRIKHLAKLKGMTLADLAKNITNSKGEPISAAGMTCLVAGGNPTIGTLEKIANAMGEPLWRLVATDEDVFKSLSLQRSEGVACPYCGQPLGVSVGIVRAE